MSSAIYAQPRPIDKSPTPTVKMAPATFTARYEGGMFGYNEKITGTLKFDDANSRLVFLAKDRREMFGIPYAALLIISPQSRSVRSGTGNVISHIPLPGAGLAGLIREKRRYMVLQFDDPDVDVKGTVNFKIENRELLASVIQTLGQKASMTQRGDAYYRPKTAAKSDIN